MAHTFLFTDIESSTRLWEEHPKEMPLALARHDSILTQSVEAAGGRVLKTMGDGMVALFNSVDDAVAASLSAQQALSMETWATQAPLRVRMGLHTGEAEERAGDYFGPTLNRTARLMAAGHGGQVLLSASAAASVQGRLDDGRTLRDLGTHRLKDLTAPEHIYQVIGLELQADFPPLNTLDSTPNNLPFQSTEFFGRDNELAEVTAMIDDPSIRLLTLLGPGGTGKTRLAIQAAAERFEEFSNGVYFVDLSTEREPAPAFEAVVRALGVPVGPDGDSLQALKTRLRDQRILIVLDNFEQVTSAAAGLAELIEACMHLQVVVTSREALRVRPERLYHVPPMALPPADASHQQIASAESVMLFTERAKSIQPDFQVTAENAPIVAEICTRLDGLPLAIELAAARLNIFSPADLLSRLEDRMDVLSSRSRDRPERQQTLWGAIEWSYELLEEDDRRFFELMSVFSTASLEALETVAGDAIEGLDALESLASLVDKSLIRSHEVEDTRRFSMLRTVRDYAVDRLAANPDWEEVARRSHAIFYSEHTRALAGLLSGPARVDTLARMSTELDNLRTAWRYWVRRGELEELFGLIDGLWALNDARGWYHAALELARDMLEVLATSDDPEDHTEDELALRVSLARAMMAIRGYGPDVEEEFQRAARLAERSGNTSNQVPVLRALATYYVMTVQFERSVEAAERILEIANQEGNRSIAIEGHLLLGAAQLDKVDVALEHLDQAIAMFDPSSVGTSRFRLGTSPGVVAHVAAGITRWRIGSIDRALKHVSDAVALARSLDHPFSLSYALYHAAFLHTQRRRFDASLECALELQKVAASKDYQIWLALGKVVEGVSRSGLGEVDEGLALTETGIEIYQGLTTPPVFWPLVLSLRALAHLNADLEVARSLIEEAIDMMGEDGIFPEFLVLRGDIIAAAAEPDLDAAGSAYRHAADLARGLGVHHVELHALNRMVDLLKPRGRETEALERLSITYELMGGGQDEAEVVRARALLGLD